MTLSVCIITCSEEANIGRTLRSVIDLAGEVLIVDSGSTDRTAEIARSFGSKVKFFTEPWKGFAAQKNSAIAKATGDWVLSLDADEEVTPQLAREISTIGHLGEPSGAGPAFGFFVSRRNHFLGRWIKHGGFYPDRKLRLFRNGTGQFEHRAVHEDVKVQGPARNLTGDLIHHAYPTLSGYIEHMNKYSSLGAEMAAAKGQRSFNVINIVVRPWLTFFYNYIFRWGFLDGKEGFLLHMYHAVYVSWKYAKAWELARDQQQSD